MGAKQSKSDKDKLKGAKQLCDSRSREMASSGSPIDSPESRAIRCHFASLAKAITDPLELSMELFSKEIIEANTKEAVKLSGQILTEKNDTLLSAVMRRVEARPSLFHHFINILKDNSDHILRELGGKLEITYNQLTPDTQEQASSATNKPLTHTLSQPIVHSFHQQNKSDIHHLHGDCPLTEDKVEGREGGEGGGGGGEKGGASRRRGILGEQKGGGRGKGGGGEQEYLSPQKREQAGSPPPKQSSAPPLATHPSILPPPTQSPVCRYANYLRAFYQTSELPAYNKWPQTPSTTFINLAVISREEVSSIDLERFMLATLHGGVDQILQVKAPIQIEEIMTPKPGKTLQCVLVEGAPGVGKTTLAWEISKKWGKGELFQQFAIVMLLQLRDQAVQNVNSITDLIFYQDQDCQEDEACRKEISHYLIQTNGRNVLIILEGLDELPVHLLTQTSVFTRLLSGTLLPQSTILVTSRPSATAHIWKNWEQRVSKHIEVLGFSDENISQYIASVLTPQQLPDFQYYLSMNTHIKTTMYIPLHAAVVIEVYRWCQHPRRPLPKTITQLYTCLVNIILCRYLDSNPDYKGKKTQLKTVTDLPPPVYAHFYSLTQLAYTGVTQQKLIFQDKDQPIHHLGFMDVVTELFPTFDNQQVSYSYNFLHLSIQEYLAAYYVSTMELHEQEQLLVSMCAQTHLQNMARFLAGITHFKDMDRTTVKKMIEEEGKSTEEREREKEKKIISTHALQLLYECGDANILDNSQCYVYPLDKHSPLFDFSTLGYCITHSSCKWELRLVRMSSTEGIEILVQALNNHTNSSYLYSIDSIDCYSTTPKCAEQLLIGMPRNVLPQLQTLELSGSPFVQQMPLPQCVPERIATMNSLHTLRLDSVTGATAVVQAVVSTNILKELKLYGCDIDHDCVTILCQWLSTSSQLETLTITLPSPNTIEMISTALTTNSTLNCKTLNIWGSKFNLPAGKAMCHMLTYNNTITEVSLAYCGIGDDIVCCLAEGLHSNNTLTTLDISHNSISDKGAESIAQALHSNNSLTTLNISRNSISDSGAESIAQVLHSNNSLTTLNISSNSISNRGAVCMAKMLKINNTLQKVDLFFNKIGNDGQIALREASNTNTHVNIHYKI